MRNKFERLPDIPDKHNEIHRKAYQTPYLYRTVTSYPTTDDLELYEEVLFVNSSVSAIRCVKISSSKVVSAGLA